MTGVRTVGENDDTFDIVLAGAGAAGIFLARELSRHGFAVALLDDSPGGYSSTRNQGWLQSGALYAAFEDYVTARQCRVGYERVRQEFPETLSDDVPAYMLFTDRDQATTVQQRIRNSAIPSSVLSNAEVAEIKENSPLLGDSPLNFGIKVPDRPVDTRMVLNGALRQAHQSSVATFVMPAQSSLIFGRTSNGWQIQTEAFRLKAQHISLTAGVLIPKLLHQLGYADLAAEFVPTKIGVCVMKPIVDSPMCLAPFTTQGPNVVPFGALGETSGISVCLTQTDVNCDSRGPVDRDFDSAWIPRFANQLSYWYPGMRHLATHADLTASFYSCQKLGRKRATSRQHQYGFVSEGDRSLSYFYAGKFTSACTSAIEIANSLIDKLDSLNASHERGTTSPPGIARQPYYEASTHRVLVDSYGEIKFEPLSSGVLAHPEVG